MVIPVTFIMPKFLVNPASAHVRHRTNHAAKANLVTFHRSMKHIVVGKPNSKTKPLNFNFLPLKSTNNFWASEPVRPIVTFADSTIVTPRLVSMTKTEEKLINLNLSATPIESVVSILSKQTGMNIVLMSKAEQKVTINVKDMTLGDALKHLAMLSGLKVLHLKDAMVMAEDATLKSSYPKEYEAEYSTPAKKDPEPQLPPAPQIEELQRMITLKFQGANQVVTALKEYFKERKVTIVALPNTTIPNVAASGAAGLSSSSGNGGAQSSANSGGSNNESRMKRILLSGPSDAVQEAIKVIEQMDTPRKQVEISVTIHDVSNNALKDAGFTWDFGQSTISEQVSGNMNFGTFSRTGLSFVNTIHALEQTGKSKLLASPNVSVMDGELGSILIGEKRRYPVVSGTNANGQFIYSTEEQNIGIYLLVAADVSEDGTVTLAVNAQVSSILGFLQLNGGSYPQISTRESKSTLILKDGQMMIMGGLLRDEEIVNLQKVPLLSQIPFFGALFSNRNTQKNAQQLLISITPHVIKSQ